MISKEKFCELLQKIKYQDQKAEEILIKLYEIFGAGAVNALDNIGSISCAVETLAAAVGDKYNCIEYLVYDCNWEFKDFLITSKGTDYIISSFEDLYDLIKEWKEK